MAVLSNRFVEQKFSVLSHDSLNEEEKDNDQSIV